MRVLVTGGTGFVGRQVVAELLRQGHEVRCLVRPGAEDKLPSRELLEIAPGDVTQPDTLPPALEGCHAVVHLVGIIREFPRRGITLQKLHLEATANVVAAARAAEVQRYLHMSALEARPAPVAEYHRTKQQAEELVMASGLTYTIFRPSIIYGPEDAFTNMFRAQIDKLRIVPVIGHGRYLLQPVPVWQVAQGFALALNNHLSANRCYDVGGPDPISFNDLIDTLAAVLGKKVVKVHLPVWPLRLLAGLLQGFAWFPVTPDQITMLLAGNTCDPSPFFQDFSLRPISLSQGLSQYLI
ncbi:MAG: complex I NDUFA9 subunit family protein [Deltaproteobacteria bacterium]|nr:complex I NDUFA9 subunit family protein [Deltaproteobacteria bacterium]